MFSSVLFMIFWTCCLMTPKTGLFLSSHPGKVVSSIIDLKALSRLAHFRRQSLREQNQAEKKLKVSICIIFVTNCASAYTPRERGGGLMVSALDSESNGPDSSPSWEHCIVFLGKTLYSHSASLLPCLQMGTSKIHFLPIHWGVEKLLVAWYYRNRYKRRSDGPLGWYADFFYTGMEV